MCETQKMKLLDYFMRSAWPHATHLLREPSGLLAGLCPEECSSAGKAHALLNRGLFSALWSCRPHLQQSQHINSDSHGRVTREPEGKAGRKKARRKEALKSITALVGPGQAHLGSITCLYSRSSFQQAELCFLLRCDLPSKNLQILFPNSPGCLVENQLVFPRNN